MMTNIAKRLHERLAEREQKGILRTLKSKSGLIDFTSNDYLGLASNAELAQLIINRISGQNHHNGAGGSRLLSGNSAAAEALEQRLAQTFEGEAALVFNSGYTANMALMATLPQRGDTILYDEYAHACIKEGARLSNAQYYAFRHNNLQDLERRLVQAVGEKFVVVESLYSMDGDWSRLKQISDLCQKYQAALLVDEAHTTAWYGPEGKGLVCKLGLQTAMQARVYTFGKALGVHGACVVADKITIDYLINFARSFIYTTALPDSSLVAIDRAWSYLQDNKPLVTQLEKNIKFYQQESNRILGITADFSPIQKCVIGEVAKLQKLSVKLEREGFDIRPIFSPTVPKGSERLRICLHAFNKTDEISQVLKIIKTYL